MNRHRIGIAIAIATFGAAAVLACGDIFHGTDSPNLCDIDAKAPGCGSSTGDASPNPTDICAADHTAAAALAARGCAWLAACESPVGKNATGACMFEAIQAYDCQANPNRRPKLAAKAFWTALAKVKSCADVEKAVLPDGTSNCSKAGFIGCGKWVTSNNPDTRLVCGTAGLPTLGENCAMQGRTCDSSPLTDSGGGNNGAQCYGPTGRSCVTSGCDGAHLVLCDDAGSDRGLDCSQFGAGQCVTSGAQPSCKPEQTTPKSASKDITCSSAGVATATASGYEEQVDCTYLSGAGLTGTDNCAPVTNAPPGTPAAAACKKTSGGCSADTCSAGKLVACVGGASVNVDCAALGLKGCDDAISTLEGTKAACTKP